METKLRRANELDVLINRLNINKKILHAWLAPQIHSRAITINAKSFSNDDEVRLSFETSDFKTIAGILAAINEQKLTSAAKELISLFSIDDDSGCSK